MKVNMGGDMKDKKKLSIKIGQLFVRMGIGIRLKLIFTFLAVAVLPLIILAVLSWTQIRDLGGTLSDIAVKDSSKALNDSAVKNIERSTTDAAAQVAQFLYDRDDDIIALSKQEQTADNYKNFGESKLRKITQVGDWELSKDGESYVQITEPKELAEGEGVSSNSENEDMEGFHYRTSDDFETKEVPLYDEITYIDLNGQEVVKYVEPDTTKVNYPFDTEIQDISDKKNTYIGSETYYEKLKDLQPGEIYVSDVIGAYVGTNYIGMYTEKTVTAAAEERGYDIEYDPEKQAYSGAENPYGQRYEGIVRWATPVTDESGAVTGYVSFALNHDHIMELVDHITPSDERYTQVSSAYEGNYAFIWDYNCRSIVHPRHHSIVGYDPETGVEQVPWLETSIYEGWQESQVESWEEYVKDYPVFNEQSREKKPALELTKSSLVGLDGRYLNNAPQCVGWMDLTKDGGSGSFYILWSGIYKLNTAAAIPYYTGQYAPSEENEFSKRGFGFVAIGSGLEDFTKPATDMEVVLTDAINDNQKGTNTTILVTSSILVLFVLFMAYLMSSYITNNITTLSNGMTRFTRGERQYRNNAVVKDEFGQLADSFDEMANSIVDSVTNSLVLTDLDKNIVYTNDKAIRFFGVPNLDSIVGKCYENVSIFPHDSEYDPIKALEEKRDAEIYHLVDRDSYLKASAKYSLDREGNVIGYTIESVDMTEVVKEQMRIESERAILDIVFSSSPDLIWYMDALGAYLTVNPRFAGIAGRKPEEFVGKHAEDMLPKDIARSFGENDRKAIETKRALYSEETVLFDDGHVEIVDSVRTPLYDSKGVLSGVLGFARDVTNRVEIEEALKLTQKQLEGAVVEANLANQHKSEFLARMSHEIRTPMNAIIGLTSILQYGMSGSVSEITKESLNNAKLDIEKIQESSQHLLSLLNDILDLSKIEAGKLELVPEVVDIDDIIKVVVSIIKHRCDEKDILFVTDFDTFEPSTFLVDDLRLRQVLINLLGNAVKFTNQEGRIEFSVKKLKQEYGKTLVEFSVKDNGIGIEEEYQKSIFESFEQGTGGAMQGSKGTGLGLAIAKRIVTMFGGNLELESEYGVGSNFHMAIWLTQAEKVDKDIIELPDMAGKLKGKRMLLVDDVVVNRIVIKTMLKDTGIDIEEAVDGYEACEKFKQSEEGYYDIILMDILMPKMDGYEATKVIRAMNRTDAKSVFIIAQTANAFQDDIKKAKDAGMDEHMAKPVQLEALLIMLFRLLCN